MSSGVKYRLDKSRYVLYNTALETLGVVAETEHGTAIFHPSQTQGVARDHLNRENLYKKINNFVAITVPKVGVRKNMTPEQALAQIDKKVATPDVVIDKKILKYTADYKKWFEDLYDMENYRSIVFALRDFTPTGIQAMVTGSKYPFDAAAQDFLKGVTHKNVIKEIQNLPENLQKRLAKFCAKNNFVITQEIAHAEASEIQKEYSKKHPSLYSDKSDVNKAIGRVADDMVRDAAKYEYFKMTGNMDVFMSPQDQVAVQDLSDEDLAKKFAPYLGQYFEDALIIKQRMENLMMAGKDITHFVEQVHKHMKVNDYCNQDIIRLMYDTLKLKYNKFNKNKAVDKFMRALLEMTTDQQLIKQINDTFDIATTKETNKKVRAREALRMAAKRIQNGDAIADTAIFAEVADLRSKYGVISTKDTYKKAKAARKPTKTQLEIVRRFGENTK